MGVAISRDLGRTDRDRTPDANPVLLEKEQPLRVGLSRFRRIKSAMAARSQVTSDVIAKKTKSESKGSRQDKAVTRQVTIPEEDHNDPFTYLYSPISTRLHPTKT